jgi:hypothetical protein
MHTIAMIPKAMMSIVSTLRSILPRMLLNAIFKFSRKVNSFAYWERPFIR